MGTQQTSEEVEQQYVKAMGLDLGRLHHRLWYQCAWLHFKWEDFEALFGTSEQRIGILNSSARDFFGMLQGQQWEDVLLHLCRLTDPPKSYNKQNLTLNRLPPLVDSTIRKEVEERLALANESTKFARDWRVRHIAHSDLDLALNNKSARPLKSASRASVRNALKKIAAVLNAVELHYTNAPVHYEPISPRAFGAVALLYVLRDGIECRDAVERMRMSGRPVPEELAKMFTHDWANI